MTMYLVFLKYMGEEEELFQDLLYIYHTDLEPP